MPAAPTATRPAASPAPVPAPPARPPGYLQRRWPAAVILAAFPAVALPMAAAVLAGPLDWVVWGYTWVFAMTHFVVTLAVYLRSDNLRYFTRTARTRTVFFAVPVLLFVGFDLYHALRVRAELPLVGLGVLVVVRLADFNHFNRQSFGVLQLFKARTGARPPAELKRTENLYFAVLTGLLLVMFLAGGVCPLLQPGGPLTLAAVRDPVLPPVLPLAAAQVLSAGLLAAAAGLFVAVLAGLRRACGGAPGFAAAAGYLLVQSAAALLAAAYFPLYLAALAVHYVEYHVLMAPRCLRAEPDPRTRLDRAYAVVSGRPVLFYAVVLAVAGVATTGAYAGMGMMGLQPGAAERSFGYLALIAVFDGLFMFHYFVEMFIWRFSDPHFRKELAGVYFAPGK